MLVIGAEERDQLFAMRADSRARIQERKAQVAGLVTTAADPVPAAGSGREMPSGAL